MALNMKLANGSDDEEDLEFLRLAALKSLQKKATNVAQPVVVTKPQKPTFGSAQTTRHHRGFRGGNRAGRNGFARGRVPHNSNLISIRTVDPESEAPVKENVDEIPKLVLPQDRYHKVDENNDIEKDSAANSNKFDRYDNSDKSDSESETEDNNHHEREDSLERLMDLLEDEINERTDKPKEKKNSKSEKSASAKNKDKSAENEFDVAKNDKTLSDSKNAQKGSGEPQSVQKGSTESKNAQTSVQKSPEVQIHVQKGAEETKSAPKNVVEEKSDFKSSPNENIRKSIQSESAKNSETKPESEGVLIIEVGNELGHDDLIEEPTEKPKPNPVRSKSRERSPGFRRSLTPNNFDSRRRSRSPYERRVYRSRSPLDNFRRCSRSPPRKKTYLDYPPPSLNDLYNSRLRSPPRNYTRPLSPLLIDQSVFSLASAPLSPRSAAFVLKNREILARRKMSPRKSLSPSPRRSLSPRRSFSPRRRSRSPRFDYKRSRSPRSRSPRNISPKRRSLSPKRFRRSPDRFKKGSRSPVNNKLPIHKRLGTQQSSPQRDKKPEPVQNRRKNRSVSLSLSPSPDRSYNKKPLNETTGFVKERTQDKPNRERPPKRPSPEAVKPEKLNPVLEARRRKFENPVQIEPNKTIKLNINKKEDQVDPKLSENDENNMENNTEEVEQFEEDYQDDGDDLIELNPTVDDLWSEEESDNENEGRFKTKSTQERTVTCLPFSKLTEKEKPKPLLSLRNNDKFDRRRLKDNFRNKESSRTKTDNFRIRTDNFRDKPDHFRDNYPKKSNDIFKPKNKPEKSKTVLPKVDVVKSKTKVLFNKSEDVLNDKVLTKSAAVAAEKDDKVELEKKEKETNVRKVGIPKEKESVKEKKVDDDLDLDLDDDEEIVIEFDDEEDEDEKEIKKPVKEFKKEKEDIVKDKDDDGGDLRAALSRKRAQRLHKPRSTEPVHARLISNALKEVGMKRKSSKADKSSVLGTITDRKVQIVKSSSDKILPTEIKKKKDALTESSTKLPIHMRLGLNAAKEIEIDDVDDDEVLMERKKKKRRKPIQV